MPLDPIIDWCPILTPWSVGEQSLPPWGVSSKGRPPPEEIGQDLLEVSLGETPIYAKTAFAWSRDQLLHQIRPRTHTKYAQNQKWLVQDLLPQEKQGPLARQELDPLVRSAEAGSIGSTSVVSAYASVVYSYSDLPSDPASAWGSASEKDSTSSAWLCYESG